MYEFLWANTGFAQKGFVRIFKQSRTATRSTNHYKRELHQLSIPVVWGAYHSPDDGVHCHSYATAEEIACSNSRVERERIVCTAEKNRRPECGTDEADERERWAQQGYPGI